jgi:predicted transcriptional regulator
VTTQATLPPKHNDQPTLDEVRVMTRVIRDHQEQIIRLGKKRRVLVLALRDHRVTYREIAEAMGSTEQNVYKIIRGDL